MPVVGRVESRNGRWYEDPLDPQKRYESVTSILSAATSKPWLTEWAARVAGQYVAANLDELMDTFLQHGPGAVADLVTRQARALRELKAEIGTHQHNVVEALLLDAPIPPVPEHLVGAEVDGERVDHDAISDGFLSFVADFDYRAAMAEATVVSYIHGYAGTLDSTGRFPGIRRLPRIAGDLPANPVGLIDVKTGKYLEATMRAQLGAYRRSDEVWGPLGQRWAMPRADFAAVLHLRREHPRGYKLVPVDTDQASFDWFLQCQRVLAHQQAQQRIGGTAIYPPLPDGSQPPPRLADIDYAAFRCRNLLVGLGITDLADLAAFTGAELLAVKGFGPASLQVCSEVLAAFGMALAPSPAAAVTA